MDFDHGNGSSKHSRTNTEESDGSGSSKHSSRHLKFDDEDGSSEGSENSKHSRRHIELDVGTGSSKHSYTYPELINGSGRIESNHFEINPEIFIKGWENDNNFVVHPEVIDGSESSKRSEVIRDDRTEGTELRLSSSSSSGSSTDQEDIKPSKSGSGITSTSSHKPAEDTQHHVSSVTHESTLTQSPPVQVMDRKGEFDPQRIPSAVFARSKSSTPMDWSIASNDSLFSIPVGNNSFSRDQVLSLKSGELFKSDEFIALSPSPVAPAVDTDQKKSVESDKKGAALVSEDAVKNKAATSAAGPTGGKPANPAVSWNSSTISSHSADSPTSGHSFAFPIGKKKKKQKQEFGCPFCYCSNCGRACCCRSNCSWAFCYGWNCSIKRCLSDTKDVSKKEKEVQQQQQQQQQQQKQPLASAASSKSVFCRCCSWFPSCRWRWHCHWSCSRNCCRRRKCC